ncbi:MAG: LLM class F420-dependent oxidoreductase [Novosphingobium sp.]|nr:LLM class F420-dependent oxidoreductase [Novosphingobium sp.]
MKTGIIYPQTELGGDPECVRRFALAAEERGYEHFLAYDHVAGATHANRDPELTGPYTEKDTFHDPFVMFAHLAGITRSIRFVSGVMILPQRQTLLVARQAADVDLFSGERLTLGIGIGWNHVEYSSLGVPFRQRGARLSEQIEVLRALWTGKEVDFSGEFHRIDRATLVPPPKRQIPIWMGGFSKASLRRAAKVGDGYIFARMQADPMKGYDFLKGFLEEEGRDIGTFGAQCNVALGTPLEEVVGQAKQWRDGGGSHFAVNTMGNGFTTLDQHLAFLNGAADRLADAGLMG